MGFLTGQDLMFTGDKYEDIYIAINERHGIGYADLFTVFCGIGFRENKKVSIKKRSGREFRSNYFKKDQKNSLYTILLEDSELEATIEDVLSNNRKREFIEVLEEYANGGMEVLVEEVFPIGIEENTRAKKYDNYIVDIMSYIYNQSQEAPF